MADEVYDTPNMNISLISVIEVTSTKYNNCLFIFYN